MYHAIQLAHDKNTWVSKKEKNILFATRYYRIECRLISRYLDNGKLWCCCCILRGRFTEIYIEMVLFVWERRTVGGRKRSNVRVSNQSAPCQCAHCKIMPYRACYISIWVARHHVDRILVSIYFFLVHSRCCWLCLCCAIALLDKAIYPTLRIGAVSKETNGKGCQNI